MADENQPAAHAATAVPMDCAPGMLQPFAEILKEGAPKMALDAARGALESVSTSIQSMAEAERASRSLNPAHRVVRGKDIEYAVAPERAQALAQAMSASFRVGAGKLDAAHQVIEQASEQIESRINASLVNPRRNETAVAMAAAQVRDAVRTMSGSERMAFIRSNIIEGDREFASAILGAPAAASGLTRKELADLRATAESHLCADDVKARVALAGVAERLRVAGSSYLGRYSSLVPRQNPGDARADEAIAKLAGKAA